MVASSKDIRGSGMRYKERLIKRLPYLYSLNAAKLILSARNSKEDTGSKQNLMCYEKSSPQYKTNTESNSTGVKTEMTLEDRCSTGSSTKEELCVWKTMEQNPKSTTFQDVNDETHPLYACHACRGIEDVCENYKSLGELKNAKTTND